MQMLASLDQSICLPQGQLEPVRHGNFRRALTSYCTAVPHPIAILLYWAKGEIYGFQKL